MKKAISLVTIAIILISILTSSVKAYTVNIGAIASIVNEQELPYHYEAEEKIAYKRLMYKAGTILYFLKRNENSFMTRFTDVEKYEDTMLERILDNGYPAKSAQELGVSEDEAYFATQEAIFAYLEHKEISKYIAENEEGQKMIDCIANILEQAKKEEVSLTQVDSEWKIDPMDDNIRYKQYRISLSPKIESVNITLENATNIQICNNQNELITTARNGDFIKIIVPKGMNQDFKVKLVYEKVGSSVYKIYHSSNESIKYILSTTENMQKEETFQVQFENLAPVTIINESYEGKAPMVGSEFAILNHSHQVVKENLVTDENGKIHTFLEQGQYFLQQRKIKDGYSLVEQLVSFEIKKLEEITLKVSNTKEVIEETDKEHTQINVVEENEKNVENDISNITNIYQKNIEKEVLKQTNETNFENTNYFVNTEYRKNIHNVTKENVYENNTWKEIVTNSVLPGRNRTSNMTKEEYNAYINNIKAIELELPILPVAIKE